MAKPKRLTDLVIHEVSCVDAGANPHAAIVLAKRDTMATSETEDDKTKLGKVEVAASTKGDGMPDPTVQELQAELQEMHKRLAPVEELSKRVEAAEIANAVLKADLEKSNTRAEETAKAARAEKDLRLIAEFRDVAKSKIPNLSGEDTEKAKLLKSLSENLPPEDCAAVMKMLEQGSTAMASHFQPIGNNGAAGANTALGKIDAAAKDLAAKEGISYAKAKSKIALDPQHKDLYEEARAEQSANRRAN